MFPFRKINDWIIQKDSINFVERDSDDSSHSSNCCSNNNSSHSSNCSSDSNPGEYSQEEDPYYGDKIGGNPFTKREEQPHCLKCKEKMQMLVQLSRQSNNHHGYAYIYQCPSHKDQVVYCY